MALRIHDSVFVAPSATLTGEISIAAGSSVWHNAVARAECQEIRIGRMTNVQDFAMVHVGYEAATTVGDFCSIAHHATVHGCTLGDACLVGIGAVIMDGAVIGAGSIVAGGAVVPEGRSFAAGSVIAGVPAKGASNSSLTAFVPWSGLSCGGSSKNCESSDSIRLSAAAQNTVEASPT